jgi:hypothetical protein
MISNEVMSIRIKLNICLIRLMYPLVIVKMFKLHIEAFHPYKGILSICLHWLLSDPKVDMVFGKAGAE